MEQTLQELVRILLYSLTALILMKGGHSMMERPEAFHIHRQVTTVVLITQSPKVNQSGLRDQMAKILQQLEPILELMSWNIAQILMRDILLRTERPELLPTHNLATTAAHHILQPNLITMIWVMLPLLSLAPKDAQMSWIRLICLKMGRLELFHTQNHIIIAGTIKMESLSYHLLLLKNNGSRDQMEKISRQLDLILELSPWNIAQILMRDSLLMMERPEQLPILNLVTTVIPHTQLFNRIKQFLKLVDTFTSISEVVD